MQLPLRIYYSTQIIWQYEGFRDPFSSLLNCLQTQPRNIKHIWYLWLKLWMIGNFRAGPQHTNVRGIQEQPTNHSSRLISPSFVFVFHCNESLEQVFTANNKSSLCLHLLRHNITWEGSHVRPATACRAMKPELWSQTPVSALSLVRCPAKIVNIQHVTSPKYTKYNVALPLVLGYAPVKYDVGQMNGSSDMRITDRQLCLPYRYIKLQPADVS